MLNQNQLFTVFIGGATLLSVYLSWRKLKTPKKAIVKSQLITMDKLKDATWEKVGHVSKIWIYPVKSMCGIALESAQTSLLGLTHGNMRDRSFMVRTEAGTMVTGRMVGELLLIKPNVTEDHLVLKHKDMEDLTVDLKNVENNKELSTTIFGDPAIGLDCGDEAAEWLSKVLKKKVRLLYHANLPSPRTTEDLVGKFPLMKANDNSLYADKYPYLLLSRASVTDLQSRVKCSISPENFRPNIFVEGVDTPFDEDEWGYIKIGDAIFRNVQPCGRCIFTTIDHKTGIKEPNKEPLETLKKYRCTLEGSSSPNFGVNLAMEVNGTISEGDEIHVIRFSKI